MGKSDAYAEVVTVSPSIVKIRTETELLLRVIDAADDQPYVTVKLGSPGPLGISCSTTKDLA